MLRNLFRYWMGLDYTPELKEAMDYRPIQRYYLCDCKPTKNVDDLTSNELRAEVEKILKNFKINENNA